MRVFISPEGFLIIADKMFGVGDDTLALNSSNVFNGERAGKERILAKRFEITPAHRSANQVYHGTERHMHSFAASFGADDRAVLPGQKRIPGSSQQDRGGQCGDTL